MAQLGGLFIMGRRLNNNKKRKLEILDAEIYEKYRNQNKKRQKQNKPLLPLPKHKQTTKGSGWY